MADDSLPQGAELRRQLAGDATRLHQILAPTEERVHDVLKLRAQRLRNRTGSLVAEPVVTLLLAQAGVERLALMLPPLLEVVKLLALTPIPGAPQHVSGVVNLHGNLWSVVDPLLLLGHGEALAEPPVWGLALRHSQWRIALGVTHIIGLVNVPRASLNPTESSTLVCDGGLAILLDIPKMLERLGQ